MDYISNIFKIFGQDQANKLNIKRGQRFIQTNPPITNKPDILEFNGMLDGKMEFSILTHNFKNIGGARFSEDDFEQIINRGTYKYM